MSTVTITARPAAGAGPAGAPRTAFVLAGGTALGAMQAGMVHALHERGITPDLLAGTSAGALNAAFPASRPRPWPPPNTGGHLARAASQRHPPAPPAHGRGLGDYTVED